MMSRDEANKIAKNISAINVGKMFIEDSINKAVNKGDYHVVIDSFDCLLTEEVRVVLIEWLKSYGYEVKFEEYEDSRSGFQVSTLFINWKDGGN